MATNHKKRGRPKKTVLQLLEVQERKVLQHEKLKQIPPKKRTAHERYGGVGQLCASY